ncbi:MAG: Uma2 family endonuclease [Chloroflexi bacterium]|nr:Uma2 family endonuclease [Chloroflexota bacterium]
MIILQEMLVSLDTFEAFVQHLENAEKIFEYIAGAIAEKSSNPYSSKISQCISGELYIYLKQHDLGHLTGEAGGYQVGDGRYAPDVAFISYEKQAELVKEGYNLHPPDLAVEVVSSDSSLENKLLTVKLSDYLAVGTLVWIVRPDDKYVEVHRAGKPAEIKVEGDTLSGDNVLPGFTLAVKDIFR